VWKDKLHLGDSIIDVPAKHFGVSLMQSLQTAKDENVEHVATLAMQEIVKRGLNTTGIFRIPGNTAKIKELQEIVDIKGTVDFSDKDILDISSLLKLYFRKLPDPLWPNDFFHVLEEIASSNNHSLEPIVDTLKKMEFERKNIWYEMILFLNLISSYSEKNMMVSGNLAICLAPTLMVNQNLDPLVLLQATNSAHNILQFMIDNAQDICKEYLSESPRPTPSPRPESTNEGSSNETKDLSTVIDKNESEDTDDEQPIEEPSLKDPRKLIQSSKIIFSKSS